MTKKISCFISASNIQELKTIRQLLQSMNIETTDAYDYQYGDPIDINLKSRIRKSDFVVIVLSNTDKNALYELGICEGLGKPVFLLMRDEAVIPHITQKYFYLKLQPDKEDILKASLQQFINQLSKNHKLRNRPKKYSKEKHSKTVFSKYINEIKELRLTGDPIQVEDLLHNIFQELQILFDYRENRTSKIDKGVDFAIWDERLSNVVGNPILVELKIGNLSKGIINRAELQLKNLLLNANTNMALLLYLDRSNKRFDILLPIKN